MWSPYEHAEQHGIRVAYQQQADAGRWYPAARLVTLQFGLTPLLERCVLAHELGHAHHGHTSSTPDRERAANRWAANMLLTAEAVAACADVHPHHPEKWCAELRVTPVMLTAWLTQADNYRRADQLRRVTA